MRKNKIRTYLKIGIFLFGITFIISSCITDDFQIDKIQNDNGLDIKRIDLKQFNSKKEIQQKLKLLSSKYDINKPYNKSNINSNDGSFTILTDEILEVTKDSITTYTFRIETPTDTLSTFENFMIKQKNDTLSFFIYKFSYDETYPEFFPYETSIQNIDESQINSENFDEYLKTNEYYVENGCLYYHHDSVYVHYSQAQIDYYGYETDGFLTVPYDELIFCANAGPVDATLDAGPFDSGGGGYNTGSDNSNNGNPDTGSGNYSGGSSNQTSDNFNNTTPNDNNININDDPASFVVLPPKGKRTTKKRLTRLVNNPIIKSKIEELFPQVFTEKYENGYRFKYENDIFTPREADEKYPIKVVYYPPFEDKETVSLHIHTKEGEMSINGVNYAIPISPIPSEHDISTFLYQIAFIDNSNSELSSDVTSLMLSYKYGLKGNLFAIVVKDKQLALDANAFLNDDDNFSDFKTNFENKVLKDWLEDGDSLAGMLNKLGKFINKHKLDGKKMGIEIYRTDIGVDTPINWEKL